MPVLGDLYPQPGQGAPALAAWRELANRITAELSGVEAKLGQARTGGSQVANQAGGVETAGNTLLNVVSSSRPSGEHGQIAGANAASVSVSQDMARAVGKASDPNTDPGPLDADAANRAAAEGAGGILGTANQIGNHPEPGPGDGGGPGPI